MDRPASTSISVIRPTNDLETWADKFNGLMILYISCIIGPTDSEN